MNNQDMTAMTPHEASVAEVQSRAEIDSQIATARKFPRDMKKAFEKTIAIVESDEDTAQACFYVLPRGGAQVQGPTIRLAEIVLAQYQNIRAQTRIMEIGHDAVVCQASCIDLENNVGVSQEIRRRITDKNGKRYNGDGITNTVNAASSIALRNAVFKIIPGVFWGPAYEKAVEMAVGDANMQQRRQKAVAYFTKLGVSEELLLKHLGRQSVKVLTKKDITYLIGLSNSLKEGSATVEDTFSVTRAGDPIDAPTTVDDLADKLEAERAAKAAPKPEPEPVVDEETGEVLNAGSDEGPPFDPDPAPETTTAPSPEPEPANAGESQEHSGELF